MISTQISLFITKTNWARNSWTGVWEVIDGVGTLSHIHIEDQLFEDFE